MNLRGVLGCMLLVCTGMAAVEAVAREPARPIVIAHRGASGYRPEHTLEGYLLAIQQGADYIEPDLVLTRDGELVIRHDHFLGTTTDVADHPEFASRKKRLDGRDDWFSEDFTLAELRTLRARQSFAGRAGEFDGRFPIPTFQEAIDLVREQARATGRRIGIYPETKEPGHFAALGFDFAGILLAQLARNPEIPDEIPIFIQSFEPEILERLHETSDLPLIQLVEPAAAEQEGVPAGVPTVPFERIVAFASGVGADKALLMDPQGRPTSFIADAHARGLLVHVWTLRLDDYPRELYASGEAEIRALLELGIDGFFTDFPDVGVTERDRFVAGRGEGKPRR